MASLSPTDYRIHFEQSPLVDPREKRELWKLKIVNETWTTVIFERHDCSHVLKKAISIGRNMQTEHDFHLRILGDFHDHADLTTSIMIPSVINPLIPRTAKEWHKDYEAIFPTPHNLPADIHVMEQIPPIPLETQRFLAKRYNPISRIPKYSTNCLVQLRLGSRSADPVRRAQDKDLQISLPLACNLPNFPLVTVAKLLADVLAILHHEVRTDADGIKFVLGGAPFPEHTHDVREAIKIPLGGRDTYLWMLNFDKCEYIGMVDDQMAAVKAAMVLAGNESFPQPGGTTICVDGEGDVWSVFVFRYLETVSERFGGRALDMAVKIVEGVVERVGKGELGKRKVQDGSLRRSHRLRE